MAKLQARHFSAGTSEYKQMSPVGTTDWRRKCPGSSKWLHENILSLKDFAWQEGYGAFSISASQVSEIVAYIAGQEEHHRIKSFQEEYLSFLKEYNVEYDERYVWG